MSKYECIMAIVNHGYSDLVMTAATKAGARGGTVLSARGTGSKEVGEFFGIRVTPEKDIVLILVPQEIRDQTLSAINEGAGMGTKGLGIAFSLPVADVVGLGTTEETKTDPKAGE
ncbi:MAG: P-II family nitrogen regulator [Bacilli bacterium]|nr:P-II family nitrogen regulator [Bacilli bacterium]